MTRRLLLICLAFAALLIPAGNPGAQEMEHPEHRQRIADPTEIRHLLTDHTLYGRYVDGHSWAEYHAPDGRTAYQENNCVYQGHWSIRGGLVCFRYEAFNDGQPACFRLYHHG